MILATILEFMQLLLLILTYLNSTSSISYESTLYLSLYLKAELRYIRFKFSAAILAPILKNMQLLLLIFTYLNSTSSISYESTLYLSLYLKAELRYIRFKFSAAILAPILKNMQLLLLIFTYLNSTSSSLYESTLFVFISESRAEIHSIQNFGGHVGRHLEKKLSYNFKFLTIYVIFL